MDEKYFYAYFKVNINVIFTHKELAGGAKKNNNNKKTKKKHSHTQDCNFSIVTTNIWVNTLHIHVKLRMTIFNKYHILPF